MKNYCVFGHQYKPLNSFSITIVYACFKLTRSQVCLRHIHDVPRCLVAVFTDMCLWIILAVMSGLTKFVSSCILHLRPWLLCRKRTIRVARFVMRFRSCVCCEEIVSTLYCEWFFFLILLILYNEYKFAHRPSIPKRDEFKMKYVLNKFTSRLVAGLARCSLETYRIAYCILFLLRKIYSYSLDTYRNKKVNATKFK